MSSAVATRKPQAEIEIMPDPANPAMTPMTLIDRAVAGGAGVETIEKLMGLQERWEANQARKAFDEALAAAKADIPVIVKNRTVDFSSAKGRTNYRHEDLAGIARTVDPILARHGLSYRFRTTSAPNEPVTVTCIVSHRAGHSEENTLSAGRDESGNKNSIQAVGSTVTYLQRYTLKAALGLAASDDDDAKSAEPGDTITSDQVEKLLAIINEVGADLVKFRRHFQIETLPELPASRYADAVAMLERKRAAS